MAVTFFSPLAWDAFPTYYTCACEPACACPGKQQQQQQQQQSKKPKKQHGKESACGAGSCARPLSRDAVETDAAFELALDVPGYAPDALALDVDEGVLSISSNHDKKDKREGSSTGDEATMLLRERSNRPLRRRYVLPEAVSAEGITASVQDGVLRVRVPKVAPAKPASRRIVVNGPAQAPKVAEAAE